MNSILACRLEVSPANNLELDALLLEWLADMPPIADREMWLRHSYGLVGNMTGVLRLLDDLHPGASWAVMTRRADGVPAFAATIFLPDSLEPLSGHGRDAANALCAAVVRAQSAAAALRAVTAA